MIDASPELFNYRVLFVSDSSKNMLYAIKTIFPNSVLNSCLFHIIVNIKRMKTVEDIMEQHFLLCSGSFLKQEVDFNQRLIVHKNLEILEYLNRLNSKTRRKYCLDK